MQHLGITFGGIWRFELGIFYVAPLSCVIGSFGVRHHQYADDTQMYLSLIHI